MVRLMRGKVVGLVLFMGCASPSLDSREQQAADPSPQFSIASATFSGASGTDVYYCPGSDPRCTPSPASQVRWGTPAEMTDKSGLGWTSEPGHPLMYNQTFKLGTLTHFNFPTYSGTWSPGATLSLQVQVTPSVGTGYLVNDTAPIAFGIDETPNFEDPNAVPPIVCAHNTNPVGVPCADKVSFLAATFQLSSATSTTVYDLHINGFLEPGTTNQVTGLISNEGQSTSAELWGLLREHCVDDEDADGICDPEDNCPVDSNSSQADGDEDGKGDACDVCPLHSPDDADDNGECGVQDPCPCDADWKNHGEFVTCVVKSTKEQVRAGDLTDAARAQLISAAAQSSCGK